MEAKVKRVVAYCQQFNRVHRDYTILLLDRDLPPTIEPMAVAMPEAVQKHYPLPTQGFVPYPIFQTEQGGYVSTSVAPLTVNTGRAAILDHQT